MVGGITLYEVAQVEKLFKDYNITSSNADNVTADSSTSTMRGHSHEFDRGNHPFRNYAEFRADGVNIIIGSTKIIGPDDIIQEALVR